MPRPKPIRPVEQHYRPGEAAKLIGLSIWTIRDRISKGEIKPVVRLGNNTTLIPASALQAFLDARTVG